MIQAIFDGMLNALGSILDFVLSPINIMIDSLFPNMNNLITIFNNFILNHIGGLLAWFSNLLPPMTKQIIIVWLGFLVAYYTIIWGYNMIIKVWNLIQKLKFW